MEKKSNKEVIEGIINDIIDATFTVIKKVYNSQRETDNVCPIAESLIIFPQYRNKTDRISEQELRSIFIEQFNISKEVKNHNLFYSIETPTENFYKFHDKPNLLEVIKRKEEERPNGDKYLGKSANIDLVVLQKNDKKVKRVALIEFKAKNPDIDEYQKDICKLINEGSDPDCLKYFIQIICIKRGCKTTLKGSNTLDKIKKKIDDLERISPESIKSHEIIYQCCNLKAGDQSESVCGFIKNKKLEL